MIKILLILVIASSFVFLGFVTKKGYAMSDRRYLNGEKIDTTKIDRNNPANDLEKGFNDGDKRFIRVCGFVCIYPGIEKVDNMFVEKYGNKMVGGSTDSVEEGMTQYAEQYNRLLLQKLKSNE
jgi:hypothetical protein